MSEASSIYTQAVMQRLNSMRHRGAMEPVGCSLRRVNPLCGDAITVHVLCQNGSWRVSFEGHGCALCLVSSDLMAQAFDGASTSSVQRICEDMERGQAPNELGAHLLTLTSRRSCVMLSWNIFRALVCSSEDVDHVSFSQGDF